MAYIGNDVDAIFLPESVNTSTSLTITGGALTQTGGNVNLDSGTLFINEALDRVGIGTTNPLQRLHVAGNIYNVFPNWIGHSDYTNLKSTIKQVKDSSPKPPAE